MADQTAASPAGSFEDIPAQDRRAIIAAAVRLVERHGFDFDVQSSRQIEVYGKLARLGVGHTSAQELAAVDPRDLAAMLTTAIELVDQHGADEEPLAATLGAYRHLTDLDSDGGDHDAVS